MTCRCGSTEEHNRRASYAAAADARDRERALEAELAKARAANDTTNYIVERVEEIDGAGGTHLVMQVRYPTCQHREFEGLKTMVFLNVRPIDALQWKSIDPHFRAEVVRAAMADKPHTAKRTEAPSPAARFPGTPYGWEDAIRYARSKT